MALSLSYLRRFSAGTRTAGRRAAKVCVSFARRPKKGRGLSGKERALMKALGH